MVRPPLPSIRSFGCQLGDFVLAVAAVRRSSSAVTLQMVIVAHLPVAIVCPAQTPAMSFLRQFTSGGIESATAVAADQSGVYVAGIRTIPGVSTGRAGVRKYDSKGNELWTREFTVTREFSVPVPGGPQFVRAAVDGTGVYLAEWTAQVVRKYSPNGDELWTRSLEFRPLAGVAAGPSGIYIAGRDFPPGHPFPYSLQNAVYLRKYNVQGVELWTRRWGERDA